MGLRDAADVQQLRQTAWKPRSARGEKLVYRRGSLLGGGTSGGQYTIKWLTGVREQANASALYQSTVSYAPEKSIRLFTCTLIV